METSARVTNTGMKLLVVLAVLAPASSAQAVVPGYVINNGGSSLTIIDMATRPLPTVVGQISAGKEPAELLILPDNHFALLTENAGNTLRKIDLRTAGSVNSLTVGTAPGSFIASPDGKLVYVVNEGSNNVSVVDVATMALVATIPVGTNPIQVDERADGQFLYVLNQGSSTVSVINAATGVVTSTVNVGTAPSQFAIHPAGQRAFIPNTVSNTVSVFDLGSNTVVSTIQKNQNGLTGTGPAAIVFSPDPGGTRVFVLENSGAVDIFDASSLARLGSIPVGANPTDMAITSDGLYAYVACQRANQVFSVDMTNLRSIQSDPIEMGANSQPLSVMFDDNENYAYVILTGTNQVALIDTNTDLVASKLTVGTGPVGLVQLNQPWVWPKGVVNGASFASGLPIAGGAIVSIFGEGLVGLIPADAATSPTSLPLPTTLPAAGGTQVFFNGTIPAPLFYVSGTQINAQVPAALLGAATATLSIIAPHGEDATTVLLAPVSPGIFAFNGQGTGPGAILHDDSTTPVTAANPARPGEVVVIYATGLGQTTPPISDGRAGVFSPTTATVTVTIGGQQANVQYAGQAPGFAGLYQVNALVPPLLTTGAYNLTVSINGVPSNAVTLAVR